MQDAVLMDAQNISEESFFFCFNYIYYGEQPDFEIINIEGDGLEDITYACEDCTADFQKAPQYKGYKMGTLGIKINYGIGNVGKIMTLNGIVFNVNGTEERLYFEHPLTNMPLSGSVNTGALGVVQVLNGCGIGTDAIFAYEANENVTINNISLGEYLELENITISVDEDSTGENERMVESFPVDISDGETIVIRGTITSEYYTGYQNVYTTSIVNYSHSGTEYNQHMGLFFEGVSDEGMVKSALEQILNEM